MLLVVVLIYNREKLETTKLCNNRSLEPLTLLKMIQQRSIFVEKWECVHHLLKKNTSLPLTCNVNFYKKIA